MSRHQKLYLARKEQNEAKVNISSRSFSSTSKQGMTGYFLVATLSYFGLIWKSVKINKLNLYE